jgi:S-DNA-T family DNA segregation ATPase FtsK/SpoIIIE
MSATSDAPHVDHPSLFTGFFLAAAGLFLSVSLWSADITLDPRAAAEECLTGLLGWYAAFYARLSVGTLPALLLGALVVLWGAAVIRRRAFWRSWPQVLGGLLLVAALSVIMAGATAARPNPVYGGLVGLRVTGPALDWMGYAGVFGAALLGVLTGGVLAFGRHLHLFYRSCLTVADTLVRAAAWLGARAGGPLQRLGGGLAAWRQARAARRAAAAEAEEAFEPVEVEAVEEEEFAAAVPDPAAELESAFEVVEMEPHPDSERKPPSVRMEARDSGRARRAPARRARKKDRLMARLEGYELPTGQLLEEPDAATAEARETLEKRARILEKTLTEFKIEGQVVGIESGPRVTMFEVSLAPGIRVERIFSLANNITMALKAYNVRIVAPIPGKDTVGIEIPNMENKLVTMQEIYDRYDAGGKKLSIPMFLGADITGSPIIADLARMPHLLIAGATGSGKSVCINAILLSVLLTKRPDELKLILVDPKMVELSRFKTVPHLMCPVVTDMKRAAGILEWACAKMDERYEQLAMVGVNNVDKFNALGEKKIRERVGDQLDEEDLETFPKRMPFIVIVIDELADLMLVAGKEVEKSIIRLASKSRAVGIHVILATQRPSVDVITGLIKANMPSRIAFQVASKVDSRTILDANGAETLLGAGDMLYLPPQSSKLVRAQGVYVTDDELFGVVEHCREQAEPEFHEELEGPVIGGTGGDAEDAERDELFDQAVRHVLENQRGSVSLLQRKLGIGYGRASRIIDQMAEAGILGPFREGKAREILLTLEEYEAAFCGGADSTGGPAPARSAAKAYQEAGAEEEEEDFESYGEEDGTPAGLRDDEAPRQDVPWDE